MPDLKECHELFVIDDVEHSHLAGTLTDVKLTLPPLCITYQVELITDGLVACMLHLSVPVLHCTSASICLTMVYIPENLCMYDQHCSYQHTCFIAHCSEVNDLPIHLFNIDTSTFL